MITLNDQLCKELDYCYWQLQGKNEEAKININREEKELLRNILLAKGIKLESDMMQVMQDGIVVIHVDKYQLIFNDVNIPDNKNLIHLAKLSNMLQDKEQKKRTWYKLKNLEI